MSKAKGKKTPRHTKAPTEPEHTVSAPEEAPAKERSESPPTSTTLLSLVELVQLAWKANLVWLNCSSQSFNSTPDISVMDCHGTPLSELQADLKFDVAYIENPTLNPVEPDAFLKRIHKQLNDDGLVILDVSESFSETGDSVWVPVSHWIELLKLQNKAVCLEYLADRSVYRIFASEQKDHPVLVEQNKPVESISVPDSLYWCFRQTGSGSGWANETRLYLCNPSRKILSLSLEMKTSSESHPDCFLGDLKLRHTGYNAAEHQWASVLLPPGGRELSVRVDGDAIKGQIVIHTEPHSRDAFLQALPFDHYQRYRMASSILEAFQPQSARILDVGGSLGFLNTFLPRYSVSQIDVAPEDTPHAFGYGGKRLPWDDEAYEAVVCIDTLEHIPPKQRQGFLHELCRVSGGLVILSCPFHEPNVEDAEAVLRDFLASHYKRTDRYLQEHVEYQLPEAGEISEVFENEGWSVTGLPNGYLPRWLLMQLLEFSLASSPEMHEGRARLHALYNQNYYENDNRFPSYRITMIATKEALTSDQRDVLSGMISSGPDQPSGDMWNIASMTASISYMRTLQEKEAIVAQRSEQNSNLLAHIKNLEQRLEQSQADHQALMNHVSNLESMLKESQQHARNLHDSLTSKEDRIQQQAQHASNLESLLKERESGMQSTNDFLKRLQTQFTGTSSQELNTDAILAGISQTEATIDAIAAHLKVGSGGALPQRLEQSLQALVELLHETIRLREQEQRKQKDGVVRVLRTSTLSPRAKQS